MTNQANGKDSIMTSYYVWIGTISDVGNIYSNLGSYVHNYIITLTQIILICQSFQVCKSRCTFHSLLQIISSNYYCMLQFKYYVLSSNDAWNSRTLKLQSKCTF